MSEFAPTLDAQSLDDGFRPLTTAELVKSASGAVRRVEAVRRSRAMHKAHKLWPEPNPNETNTANASPFVFPALAEPAPWPEPVFGPDLLVTLAELFREELRTSAVNASTLALWTLHTWCLEWAPSSPRLALVSAVPNAGKSTVLALLGALVPRPLPLAHARESQLLTLIDQVHPTLLLDDAERWAIEGGRVQDLLIAGHARGAQYLSTVDWGLEPPLRSCFTPCAFSMMGAPPPEMARRSIVIALSPALAGEYAEPEGELSPEWLAEQRRKCARWAQDHGPEAMAQTPAPPPGFSLAKMSTWRPLLAIAQAAGEAWRERGSEAALALGGDESEGELARELLEDIRMALGEAERISSDALVKALTAKQERPWRRIVGGRALDARGLAKALAPFGIRPRVLRTEEGSGFARGYVAADFSDAFARHLEEV